MGNNRKILSKQEPIDILDKPLSFYLSRKMAGQGHGGIQIKIWIFIKKRKKLPNFFIPQMGNDKFYIRKTLDGRFKAGHSCHRSHVITISTAWFIFKMRASATMDENDFFVLTANLINFVHTGIIRGHFLDMGMDFYSLEPKFSKTLF